MGGGAGRGRKGGPTGRRTFSTVEDMKSGQTSQPAWKNRRNREGEGGDEEQRQKEEEEEEDEEEEEEEEEAAKPKGLTGLIDVQNPNAPVKSAVKASSVDLASAGPSQLSRREREELEKLRSKERYMKLQAEGKTEQAQKDLARLELIRKQREEAAKKREEEKAAKEARLKDARK